MPQPEGLVVEGTTELRIPFADNGKTRQCPQADHFVGYPGEFGHYGACAYRDGQEDTPGTVDFGYLAGGSSAAPLVIASTTVTATPGQRNARAPFPNSVDIVTAGRCRSANRSAAIPVPSQHVDERPMPTR